MGKDNQTSQLKLLLLGSPRVELAGTPLEVSRRKAIALLAYLAVTGEVHQRETLATLLWPDYDESKAHAYLRRTLWSLKKTLGDEYLVAEREQIGLVHNETVWLDIARFRQLLSETRTHHHPPDEVCDNCLTLQTEAADLYRGDFLTGFTLPDAPDFDEWQFFQAESLRQELASVLERLIQGHSAHGDFEAAIPHARRWLSLDPLHEPAHQQLMRLYAWSGKQAAALRQYQECVRIFDEEFGASPSEETTALYEAIKAKRLSPPAEAEEPFDLAQDRQGSRGVGEESSPLLLSPSAPQHNLPSQSTPLFGRKAELTSLDEFLTNPDVRLVTIVGPGGMGKTWLSLAAGTAVSDHFPDGIFFIPLAPVQTADKIVLALAEQLGFLFHGDTNPEDQILKYLKPRRFLLIFDNFEHVIVGAQFIAAILQHAPDITMLVTSRERLNIAGEAVFRLGGLSYPDSESTDPVAPGQAEAKYGALELFLHHARLARPDLDFDQNTLTQVTRICKLVQGMPLAIILAVSWIETLALDELAEAIAGSVDILASEQRDLPPRQRSIRAAFETSWQRLAPVDQAIYAKLSVFRGGFNRKAAEVVAEATLFTLRSLIEKSLLVPAGPDRYELHDWKPATWKRCSRPTAGIIWAN